MIDINQKFKTCWIVTEGMAGTENQCLGVAEALGMAPEIKRVALRQPWKTLSPYIKFEQDWTFQPKLASPWPDLLIASGRKSVAASRYIKKASGGKTFTVQIQDPRVNPSQFDLVAIPAHDPARGENVIITTAAPNRITPERLTAAKEKFSFLGGLPSPRIAVLIGGSSKAHTMTPDVMRNLGARLNGLRAQGYGLMITASRRTGKANRDFLFSFLSETVIPAKAGIHASASANVKMDSRFCGNDGDFYFWNGAGENPYMGYLAWADFIIVTEDSVSMISEALTAGKPTYVLPLPGGGRRLDAFIGGLRDKRLIRFFEGKLEAYDYPPLRDAEKIAAEIKKRLKV